MIGHNPRIVRRILCVSGLWALFVLATGCAGDDSESPSNTEVALSRPCEAKTLRVHGSFQGALGSQFGGVTISTVGGRPCQLRGGRAKVLVYVSDKRIPVAQYHNEKVPLSDGPRIVTIPVAPIETGPGFRFEWRETCLPKGLISVRVQFPGTRTRLRVAHETRIAGPRCYAPGESVMTVSLIGPYLGRLDL